MSWSTSASIEGPDTLGETESLGVRAALQELESGERVGAEHDRMNEAPGLGWLC